ncbi:KH domain-containing protein [Candidatus Saccharibacteria bacterium]|nr:KH domain-containing protein [Candidatus Saccharibacteria bacterium]
MDQQFIEYIVKSLVNNPDSVKIKRTIDEKGVLLELEVDAEDLGRVIGKRGATAQSLRTLLRALGTKNDARYNLKIVDTGEPGSRPAPRNDDKPADDNDDDAKSRKTKDEPADEEIIEEEQVEEVVAEDEPSDVVSRTRAELADLDDLDV